MTEQFAADMLICGAGAAGLTLAIDLARRGVSFRLIEKMGDPFRGSRGKGIQPRSQEIFEDLGILDRIVAVGGIYPQQREYRADGRYTDSDVVEHQEPTPPEPYHLALMAPQFLTEGMMRERLLELGHRPEFGCELVGFEQDEDGVTARLVSKTGKETVRVRYLIGADGGRSVVRHTLDIGFPGKTLGVRAIVADVMLTGLSRDVWHRFAEGDMERQISLCPLAGTEVFQITALFLKGGHAAGQARAEAGQDEAVGERHSFRSILTSPVIRILLIVLLCHYFSYGLFSSELAVFLGDTFLWNGHAFGPRELGYILTADGAINIVVQLLLLKWLGSRFSERNLIVLVFCILSTGYILAGFATQIPTLALAVLCVSTGTALARPTFIAALSVHVPRQRQGVVMGWSPTGSTWRSAWGRSATPRWSRRGSGR